MSSKIYLVFVIISVILFYKGVRKMLTTHKNGIVNKVKLCDFCSNKSRYDGKTNMGFWANMCDNDFSRYGIGLGEGKGKEIVVKDKLNERRFEVSPGTLPNLGSVITVQGLQWVVHSVNRVRNEVTAIPKKRSKQWK